MNQNFFCTMVTRDRIVFSSYTLIIRKVKSIRKIAFIRFEGESSKSMFYFHSCQFNKWVPNPNQSNSFVLFPNNSFCPPPKTIIMLTKVQKCILFHRSNEIFSERKQHKKHLDNELVLWWHSYCEYSWNFCVPVQQN